MVAIFPASAKGGGLCLAFPDVCKVPPLGISAYLIGGVAVEAVAQMSENQFHVRKRVGRTDKVRGQAERITAVCQNDRIVLCRELEQLSAEFPDRISMLLRMNLDSHATRPFEKLGCLLKGLWLKRVDDDPLQ